MIVFFFFQSPSRQSLRDKQRKIQFEVDSDSETERRGTKVVDATEELAKLRGKVDEVSSTALKWCCMYVQYTLF